MTDQPEEQSYDIIVIGSGPGGQKAAVKGAKAGKSVALIERENKPGGACLFQGTIPSKTLREAALTIYRLKAVSGFYDFKLKEGLEVASLMNRLREVLTAHTNFINTYIDENNITYHHGRAKLVSKNQLQLQSVDGTIKLLNAEHIVIATGSRPRTPPNIPVDHENILDSDSILSMVYLPRSITVIGGGVIGAEYASIFSLLGVKVTLVDRAPRPLMFMDPEITNKFLDNFKRNGGTYMGEQNIKAVSWDGVSQVKLELESGETVMSDKLLVCQGRLANVERLGLEEIGIEQGKYGHIVVDKEYRTNVPNIFAVGDVIGPPALASCSMEQGRRAICHALGEDPGNPFHMVPMGIYSVPELASVGLSESEAREKFGSCTVGRARFEEVSRGQIAGMQDGMLKLVGDPQGKKLLGIQIVCDGATDLVHVGEMALLHEANVSVFIENIMNFPTLGEAYRIAAHNLINKDAS